MAKTTTIPQNVLVQMFSLTVEQIEAVIRSGGGSYTIDKVECLGMMPGGKFIYALTGKDLPTHIKKFQVKIVIGDAWNAEAPRVLEGGFVLYWA